MTQPDIEQIQARAEAATPGPWKMWNGWGPLINVEPELMACERVGPDYEGGFVPGEGAVDIYASRADFEFVAAAREDIPALLAAIDGLTAENAKLTEVVDVAAECYNARLDSDMPVPWWRLKFALDALTKAVQ